MNSLTPKPQKPHITLQFQLNYWKAIFQDGLRRPFWIFANYDLCPHFWEGHPSSFIHWPSKKTKKTLRNKSSLSTVTEVLQMTQLEIWHGDAHSLPTGDRPLKFRIFENSRWRRPPSWKSQKNRDISATATPILTEFGTAMQNGSPNRTYL